MSGNSKPLDDKALVLRLDVNFALQAAGLGVWELDPATNLVAFDAHCRQLFGFTTDAQVPCPQWLERIHPDDRPLLEQATQSAGHAQPGGDFDITCRTITADNSVLCWVRISGKSYFSAAGDVYRFAGVAQDVTRQTMDRWQQHQWSLLVDQSPDALAITDLQGRLQFINNHGLALFGLTPDQVPARQLTDFISPEDKSRVASEIMPGVLSGDWSGLVTLLPFEASLGVPVTLAAHLLTDPGSGQPYGIACIMRDRRPELRAEQEQVERDARFRSLIEEAPVSTCLFVGPDMIIDVANEVMLGYWGRDRSVIGKPLAEALPELKDQPHLQILEEVYRTGKTYEARNVRADLQVGGVLKTYYFDLIHKPLRNADGQVYAIMDMSMDVTQQVIAQQQLKESEARLRSLIESAPFPIGVYTGPQMIIQFANQSILNAWGKGDQVIGKPYAEVLPELAGQGIYEQLTGVYQTGVAFHAHNQRVDLVVEGKLQTFYFKYSFTPLYTEDGQVYGVMNTAADVTDLVVAQQKLEEVELSLRGAVELAQLGTWSIDVATNGLTYSDRLIEWFGYDPAAQAYGAVIPILLEEDQARVAAAVAWALNPQSSGVYDEVYTVIHPETGQKRVLHAHGKTVFDATGKPVRLNGTAQDITMQRELQQTLEQQVRQRTRELGIANEELAITNEELASTMEELAATNEVLEANNEEIAASNEQYIVLNEELQATNELLSRSNDSLQRFAYVASHDLQEPLRKIQQFGDLIKTDHALVSGDALTYVDRMQSAARRMSALIKDLLSFSQLAHRQEVWLPVSLNKVMEEVLADLELIIQETGAQVTVEPLPTVVGDPLQLGQLMQNLLSNALKFQRPGVAPLIEVKAQLVLPTQLPPSVKPIRSAQFYHHLDVRDNGIGFDEQYVERIFQVFQRLHRKHEYAGTGIGLSICERVVTNHGGALTATSQPGQGAVFSVYLPI